MGPGNLLTGFRLLVVGATAVLYGAWAARGIVGGAAYARGKPLASEGRYEEALPLLERAGSVPRRLETCWLRGEVRLGRFDRLEPDRRRGKDGILLLESAAEDLLEAASACPASGWPWSGLAETYERLEREGSGRRSFDLSLLEKGPWARVGRPGRVAVGLARIAIEKEPQVAAHHDRHALILYRLGLETEALEAVRAAARALPLFDEHSFSKLEPFPREFLEAFAEESRKAIGKAPLLSRERHYLGLGQLERRLGRLDRAEADLRAALEEPADSLRRAEDYFHLAMVLSDQRKWEEADRAYERAAEAPVFRPASALARARIAEELGRPERALDWLAEARRLRPADPDLVLAHARLARRLGRFEEAIEAYRWAVVLAPGRREVRLELARTELERANLSGAESAVRDFERDFGPDSESRALLLEIARAKRRPS